MEKKIKETTKQIVGYTVWVTPHELSEWETRIQRSEQLAPEIVGYLLGRAKPVVEDILCEECKQPIDRSEEYKPNFNEEFTMRYDGKKRHVKCVKLPIPKR